MMCTGPPMNKYEKNIRELLHESGTVLVRDGRHKVFRLEDGQNFITSKTPSTQGAARESLATLRRLLDHSRQRTPAVPPESPMEPIQGQVPRFVTPNNPERERGEVTIPKLSPSDHSTNIKGRDASIGIKNIIEVLMAADQSDRFWDLDPCGRIRALTRLTKRFAKVEILPVLFCKASVSEIHHNCAISQERDENFDDIAEFRRGEGLYFRTLSEWGWSATHPIFTGIPSMLVHDPLLGSVLVEASAWSLLENTNYIFFWHGELEGTSYGIASQVWDSEDPTRPANTTEAPDHFIYSTFITRPMMKRKAFTLQTCASWTDQKSTRAAIRQILEIAGDQQARGTSA
jgi:hypothetical protein